LGLAFLSGSRYAWEADEKCSDSRDAEMHQSSRRLLFDLPGRYRIRVQGQLSANWSYRLSDMVITTRQPAGQPPVTTLTAEVRDQTALMGVLNILYDMGCPLLKVERLDILPAAEDLDRSGEAI
jgi:hypothetical protein